MTDMSQQKVDSLYTMFVGTPGTRKSTSALTWPTPQYWVCNDRKMKSMLLPLRHFGIDPKLINFDNYSDWDGPKRKLENFLMTCPYRTVIIDSVTSLADGSLNQLKGKQGGGKKVGTIQVNSIEDYNAESSALMELISLTKDLQVSHQVNIILIAHLIQAEYKQNPNSPANVVRTIVTAGKRVAPKIPAYCEEVYHFFVEKEMDVTSEGGYSILTSSNSEDFARTGLPLERKIQFNNEPLYNKWIKPAIDKLNGDL